AITINTPAVSNIVTEFRKYGINKYPISKVPKKLPTVLTADNRPTLPPTVETDAVTNRIKNGVVIAIKDSGTKNNAADARKDPAANGRSRQAFATGRKTNVTRHK
ncbi:MAG: hypothetical protein RI897_4697, partial [Verrucomicrobiota bacterium]